MSAQPTAVFDYRKQIRKYGGYYLFILFLILGVKYHFSEASCESVKWILAPTCLWVRILSGIPFEWIPGVGYTSHSYRFIIAASCSGLQFMLISTATLCFSFLHRMEAKKKIRLWILCSIGFSYFFTIFINGLRILLSIYIPILIFSPSSQNQWITKEQFHMILGIVVYFTSLFLLYQLADEYSLSMQNHTSGSRLPTAFLRFIPYRKYMMPFFWYFSIVLGIPVLNKAYRRNRSEFEEYARFIIVICISLLVLFYFLHRIQRQIKKQGGG